MTDEEIRALLDEEDEHDLPTRPPSDWRHWAGRVARGLAAGALVYLVVSTYSIVNSHNTELNTTKENTQAILGVVTGQKHVNEILGGAEAAVTQAANSLERQFSTNHTISYRQLVNVCTSIDAVETDLHVASTCVVVPNKP